MNETLVIVVGVIVAVIIIIAIIVSAVIMQRNAARSRSQKISAANFRQASTTNTVRGDAGMKPTPTIRYIRTEDFQSPAELDQQQETFM